MDPDSDRPSNPSSVHTLPLRYSPAPCLPEDILVPGLSDYDSDRTRRKKRLRREAIGREYLTGKGGYRVILTAKLKGPFEKKGWRNPWAVEDFTPKATRVAKRSEQVKCPKANNKRKRARGEIPTTDRKREVQSSNKKVLKEEHKKSERVTEDKSWLSSNVHRVKVRQKVLSGLMSPTPERQQISVPAASNLRKDRVSGGLLPRGPEGSFISSYERPLEPSLAEIESDEECSAFRSKKVNRQVEYGYTSDEGTLDPKSPDTKPRIERRVFRRRIQQITALLNGKCTAKEYKDLILEQKISKSRIVDLTAEIRNINDRRKSKAKKREREAEVTTPKGYDGDSARRKKQKMSFSDDKVVLPTPLKGDLPISNKGKEIANARKIDERLPAFIYSSTATPTDPDDPSATLRCQRCKLQHKACDKKYPCQRCSDAGIGDDGCVFEEKRKAREQEAVKRLKVITEHGIKQKEQKIVVATEDLLSLINGTLKPQDQESEASEESINTAWQRDHAGLFSAIPTVPQRKKKAVSRGKDDTHSTESLVAEAQSVEDIIDQALGLSPVKTNGDAQASRSHSTKSAETSISADSIALLQPSGAPVVAASNKVDLLVGGGTANGGTSTTASSSRNTPKLPAYKSFVPKTMANTVTPVVQYPAFPGYQSFVPEAMAKAVAGQGPSTDASTRSKKKHTTPDQLESEKRNDKVKAVARPTRPAKADEKDESSSSESQDTPIPANSKMAKSKIKPPGNAHVSESSKKQKLDAVGDKPVLASSKMKPSKRIKHQRDQEQKTPVAAKRPPKRRISFTPGGNIKQALVVHMPSVSFENYETIPSSQEGVQILREITSPKLTSGSIEDQAANDKSTSGGKVLPEAQVPALPHEPSGPSSNLLETDKQSLKFVSTEEDESIVQFSTQAELSKAQKNLQGDLQSPNKPPILPIQLEEPDVDLQTDDLPDQDAATHTPVRITDALYPESTQAMIDNLSPFADSTTKKPKSFLHALTRPAAAILDYVGWGSQMPSQISSEEQAGQIVDGLVMEENLSLTTAEATIVPSALALNAEAAVVYPQISFDEVVREMQTSSDTEGTSPSHLAPSCSTKPARKSTQPPPFLPSGSTEEDKIVYDDELDSEITVLPTSSKHLPKSMRVIKLPPEPSRTRLASPIRIHAYKRTVYTAKSRREADDDPIEPSTDELGISLETYDSEASTRKPIRSSNNALDKLTVSQSSLFRPSQNRKGKAPTNSNLSTPRSLVSPPRPVIPESSASRQTRGVKVTPKAQMGRSDKSNSVEARGWDGRATGGDTPEILEAARSFLGASWDVEGEVRKMGKRG